MKKRRTARLPLVLMAGVPVITLAIGTIAFGPARALRIAGAGAAGVLVDGLAQERPLHRVPVLDLWIARDVLGALNADPPWSGNDPKPAELRWNGIRYPALVRYRGLFVGTHYLGGKKSMRLTLPRNNPLSPYRRVNLLNPKAIDMLNQHMAYWIGSRMGVAVPWSELVFVDLNGAPHGVHHAIEQVDGDFERNRHLVDREVPVFKGDYPPATGRQRPEGRYLYGDAGFWEYASDADSTQALAQLRRLIAVVNNDTLPDDARLDSLALFIDIDAFVRYHAALKVLHSTHEDNVHNQWLVLSPRSGRFYPVLWDPILLFSKVDPFYPIHDAIEFHLMRHADLRLQRDRYVVDALKELEGDSLFDRRLDTEIERLLPSVLADRNKHGEITDHAEDVLRFSALHWARACDRLRTGMHAYWRTLEDRMHIDSLVVEREGDVLIARWTGDGVLGYEVHTDTVSARPVDLPFDRAYDEDATGALFAEVVPAFPVSHSMGDKVRVLKDGEYWSTPRELRIQLNGTDPERITFVNLTTRETLEARH